jgi:hypothetical protein
VQRNTQCGADQIFTHVCRKDTQLTNVRAAGKDDPIRHTLESAVEFIADDELVEITPSASAQAPAARARAQTRLPRRRLRKSPPAGGVWPPVSAGSSFTRITGDPLTQAIAGNWCRSRKPA